MDSSGQHRGGLHQIFESLKNGFSRLTGSRKLKSGPSAQTWLSKPQEVIASGVLRRRRRRGKRTGASWHLVYVVICSEGVYYYEDETSEHPLGIFSLRGYKQITAREVDDSTPTAFSILPARDDDKSKIYTFATLPLDNKKEWMTKFKKALVESNRDIIQKSLPPPTPLKQAVHKPRAPSPVGYHSDDTAANQCRSAAAPPSADLDDDIERPIYDSIKDDDIPSIKAWDEDDDTSRSSYEEPCECEALRVETSSTKANEMRSRANDARSISPPPISPNPPLKSREQVIKADVIEPRKESAQHHPAGSVSVMPRFLEEMKLKQQTKPPVAMKPAITKSKEPLRPEPLKGLNVSHSEKGVSSKPTSTSEISKLRVAASSPSLNSPTAGDGISKLKIYWHGSKDDSLSAISLHKESGTYLVRQGDSDDTSVVLVVHNGVKVVKVRLQYTLPNDGRECGMWSFNGNSEYGYETIEELVKHHSCVPLQLCGTGVLLTEPLPHPNMRYRRLSK